jgi:hypothetical protein
MAGNISQSIDHHDRPVDGNRLGSGRKFKRKGSEALFVGHHGIKMKSAGKTIN